MIFSSQSASSSEITGKNVGTARDNDRYSLRIKRISETESRNSGLYSKHVTYSLVLYKFYYFGMRKHLFAPHFSIRLERKWPPNIVYDVTKKENPGREFPI